MIDFVDDATANAVFAFLSGETDTNPPSLTPIELAVNGQSLSGKATFSQPDDTLLQIVVSDVVVRLGDAANPLITVTGTASATLTLTPDTDIDEDGPDLDADTDEDNSNLAGNITGTITTTVDKLVISGTVSVSVDAQRSSAITATTAPGTDLTVAGEKIDVAPGVSVSFERVVGGGDAEIRITGLADQTITLGEDGDVVTATLLSVAGDGPTFTPTLTVSPDGVRMSSVNAAGNERPTDVRLSVDSDTGVTVDSSLAINNVTSGSNVVTVATNVAHGLTAGQTVVVDSTDNGFDGAFVVSSVVDPTHFTYALTGANTSLPIGGGTLYIPLAITLDTTTTPGRFRISGSRLTLTVGGRSFTTVLTFEALPDSSGGRPVIVTANGLATRVDVRREHAARHHERFREHSCWA